jgi:hypothetical protein
MDTLGFESSSIRCTNMKLLEAIVTKTSQFGKQKIPKFEKRKLLIMNIKKKIFMS